MLLVAGAVDGVETSGQDKATAAVQARGLVRIMEEALALGLDKAMAMEMVPVLGLDRPTVAVQAPGPARAAEVVAVAVAMVTAMAGPETALMPTPSLATLSPSVTSHSLQSAETSRRSFKATATPPAASAILAALP